MCRPKFFLQHCQKQLKLFLERTDSIEISVSALVERKNACYIVAQIRHIHTPFFFLFQLNGVSFDVILMQIYYRWAKF